MSKQAKVEVRLESHGDAALLEIEGSVDERFDGFGPIAPGLVSLIIDVSRVTRISSFGVRRWLMAMTQLPKGTTDVYLLGCPTFFVDQLNMILNFGGQAKVLTVRAPYTCEACGSESVEKVIDVIAERDKLVDGVMKPLNCERCGGQLSFDESPETYFTFLSTYAPSSVSPRAAALLAAKSLYHVPAAPTTDVPPRIIKLVQDTVTYFKICGSIGAHFRARPLVAGAEGHVVIDVSEVERFAVEGQPEWERLVAALSKQVISITIADVGEAILAAASQGVFRPSRYFRVASLLAPFDCHSCGKVSRESIELEAGDWSRAIGDRVCPSCGGRAGCTLQRQQLEPLARMHVGHLAEDVHMVLKSRQELLSRAMVQATVARAGGSPAPSVDVVLGKYQLIRPLVVGGMAEVFLAKQTGIEKPVALKRIHRRTLESQHLAIDMFLNEAKIAARIVHPNITQVFDVGEERGALFLAMEYVHGKDLRLVMKALRDRSELAPLAQTIYVLREVASALHYAYWSTDLERRQLKVVHRDVSPHNVLLSYDGTVKLADFGVALSSVTTDKEKMVTGKWGYMSPEQSRGEPLDHRSDLFALGIILYQLCSGLHPFGGGKPREIAARLRQGVYVPLSKMTRHVPSSLIKLIDELLQPVREQRPDTGADVAARLERIATQEGFEIGPARLAGWLATQFPLETATPIDAAGSFELLPQSMSQLRTPTGSLRYTPTGSPSPAPTWKTAPEDVIDMLPTTVLPSSVDRTQPDPEFEAVEVDSSVEESTAPSATPPPELTSRRKSRLQFEAPRPTRSVRTPLFVLLLITMTAAAVYLAFLIVETL